VPGGFSAVSLPIVFPHLRSEVGDPYSLLSLPAGLLLSWCWIAAIG
jgi:hypothetical protein